MEMSDKEPMRLDQFLKLSGAVGSGGQAKLVIQDGQVSVNGEAETRRRRKLIDGDVVRLGDGIYRYEESLGADLT